MGQKMGVLWGRIEGKQKVRNICDKVFDHRATDARLALKDLHIATLLVYNDVNRNFPGPHKEPPSDREIEHNMQLYQYDKLEALDRDQFYQLILKWISKDLRIVVLNKFLIALLAAPTMAIITKRAGEKVPGVRRVAVKIPTAVFFSAYTIGFVLLQDYSVAVD